MLSMHLNNATMQRPYASGHLPKGSLHALDVRTLSLNNVVGNAFFMCTFHPILPPSMVLEHTNICIYYEDLFHCFKNIPSNPGYVLVTANGTTWQKALCWNLDSKLLALSQL